MKRLFGTDGIRATAGEVPLDPTTVRLVGFALADVLTGEGDPPRRVALGRDTRESGPWLRDAIAAGLRARGASATEVGVITTPGLAHVVRHGRFDAGVMISASHNPFRDNGLKLFGADGQKLSDESEQRIERRVLDDGIDDPGESDEAVASDPSLARDYLNHLEQVVSPIGRFRGLHLLLDCANGSATSFAPEIFRHHGAKVEAIGADPNGRNINLECGSLHLDRLAEMVGRGGFDLGLAFDGDADRCLAVDAKGRIVDGDHILFITGRRLKRQGRLPGDGVVATIMSNFWLEDRLAAEQVRLHRAQVGDKYVLQRMEQERIDLGGEQSGHIIFRRHATTGDGILTGLLLLDTLLDEPESLTEIMDGIVPYPQVLLNVRVREKPDLREHESIGPLVGEVEQALRGQGRVVLRYSGTEPLARVMVEGRDAGEVQAHARRLADAIRERIGE